MENKLGLSEEKLLTVERKIVNIKLNLLDEYFSFNQDIFSLEYLKNLHRFLFSDLYDENIEIRKSLDIEEIKNILISIQNECINICTNNFGNTEKLLELIYNIWELQPFFYGNTRTLLAYLKILNYAFLLNLNIDLNKEIESKPQTFNKENFVNQKQLTKK